jgi:hypothetical protein
MIKPKPTPTTAPATPRTTKRTKLSDEQIRALRARREQFDPYSYGFTKLSALEGEGSW